ncbi:hypothetical protein KABACHOK_01360 [Brevundimonas phage vB_BpoS-Kabachok]|uniref:Uncharacterized protein n=1 Tax=Brevundimonas phage vB_BpoS-Kabachok TaxID=2948600 RepID=A0A9E7MQG1_9CAUD|nr:hypothetical protein KABACHOK_01360 [Brevundimonas phage vB_BpoS-Kabachok]
MDGLGGDYVPRPALSDAVIQSWDRVSAAIDAMVLAQPSHMTEAATRLREAQAAHTGLILLEGRLGR